MPPTTNTGSGWEAGFGREIITPPLGTVLAGYFRPRPSMGVLDDLHVRALVLRRGKAVAGICSLDLIFVTREMVGAIRQVLRRRGLDFADNVNFSATHTHTGPFVSALFGVRPDQRYLRRVVAKAALAIEQAYANLAPASLHYGGVRNNPLAFNRRYITRSGQVLTNPGRRNPEVVRPEGTVDREIGVLAVKRAGEVEGLVVNIVNHTDSTGGARVSADWPGHLERFIRQTMGWDVPVLTLVGCAGNINHLNTSLPPDAPRSNARTIGLAYGQIVLRTLRRLQELPPVPLRAHRALVPIPFRKIPPADLAQAQRLLQQGEPPTAGLLASEHLRHRGLDSQRFFAERLLHFHHRAGGKSARFEVSSLEFGRQLAVVFLPGECFTEIGLAIKKASPFTRTFVASLSNGTCGYVPMRECFARGGYETLPVEGGGVREDAAEILINTAVHLLHRPTR